MIVRTSLNIIVGYLTVTVYSNTTVQCLLNCYRLGVCTVRSIAPSVTPSTMSPSTSVPSEAPSIAPSTIFQSITQQ